MLEYLSVNIPVKLIPLQVNHITNYDKKICHLSSKI